MDPRAHRPAGIPGLDLACLASFLAAAPGPGGPRAPAPAPSPGSRPPELSAPVPAAPGGWELAGEPNTYDRETIYAYIDGAGEVYLQYAFRSVRVYDFARDGEPDLSVQVFDMGTPEDAFGMFSLEREDEAVGIGNDSEYGAGMLRFWKDRYLVCATATRETSEAREALLAMGRSLAASIPRTGERPRLLRLLPPRGLVAASERYFHGPHGLAAHYPIAGGNPLGLGSHTEALLASYAIGGTRSRLLIVVYPRGEEAAAAHQALKGALAPPLGAEGVSRAPGGGWQGARRHGRVVAALFDAPTRKDLEAFLDRLGRRIQEAPWTR